jgi:hypothetical protein
LLRRERRRLDVDRTRCRRWPHGAIEEPLVRSVDWNVCALRSSGPERRRSCGGHQERTARLACLQGSRDVGKQVSMQPATQTPAAPSARARPFASRDSHRAPRTDQSESAPMAVREFLDEQGKSFFGAFCQRRFTPSRGSGPTFPTTSASISFATRRHARSRSTHPRRRVAATTIPLPNGRRGAAPSHTPRRPDRHQRIGWKPRMLVSSVLRIVGVPFRELP